MQHYVVAASRAAPWGGQSGADEGGVGTPGTFERSMSDQPDAVDGYQTHVLYFVPKDKPDQDLDAIGGPIRNAMHAMQAWFAAKTSPRQRRPRFDVTSGGTFDVTYVAGEKNATDYTSLDSIRDEIKPSFSESKKRYLIFAAVNRGETCGEGYYPIPPAYDAGQYAAVYLDSDAVFLDGEKCHGRDYGDGTVAGSGRLDTIAMHEWLHNEGVAPLGAPHHCASEPYHVCTGPLWLMEGADPEQHDVVFPFITGSLKDTTLDDGNDDYLDTPWPWITNVRDSVYLEDA